MLTSLRSVLSPSSSPKRFATRSCAALAVVLCTFFLCAIFLCAMFVGATKVSYAGEGWWGDLDRGQHVQLSKVLQSPRSFQSRTLTFVAIFHKRGAIYQPFRSHLTERNFDNFAVWTDGAEVWEERDFTRDYPFLYLPKSSPHRSTLLTLEKFTRVEITARITSFPRGRPVMEVLSLRRTGHLLGRSVVRELIKSKALMSRGSDASVQRAARKYRDLLITHPDLPKVYESKVRRHYADSLRQLGETAAAARVDGGSAIRDSWGRTGASWSDEPGADEDDPFENAPFNDDAPGRGDDPSFPEPGDSNEGGMSGSADLDAPQGLPGFPGDSPGANGLDSSFPNQPSGVSPGQDGAPGFDAPGSSDRLPGVPNRAPDVPTFPDEDPATAGSPPTFLGDEQPARASSDARRRGDAPTSKRGNRTRFRGHGAFALPSRGTSSSRRTTTTKSRGKGRSRSPIRSKDPSSEWRTGSARDLPAPGTSPLPGIENRPSSGPRGATPRMPPTPHLPGGIAPRRRTRISGVK